MASEAEVKARAKNVLVDKGIEEGDADYLAELYANSPRGKEHQKPAPASNVIAANCTVGGILPIG